MFIFHRNKLKLLPERKEINLKIDEICHQWFEYFIFNEGKHVKAADWSFNWLMTDMWSLIEPLSEVEGVIKLLESVDVFDVSCWDWWGFRVTVGGAAASEKPPNTQWPADCRVHCEPCLSAINYCDKNLFYNQLWCFSLKRWERIKLLRFYCSQSVNIDILSDKHIFT